MKAKILMACIVVLFISCKKDKTDEVASPLSPLNVATYNIRVESPADVDNPWSSRVYLITDMVKKYNFDIFGTQEVNDNQLADLTKSLPTYYNLGAGRDDGFKGEHASIFFKKEKYTLLGSGDFWLSETPGLPGKGWDAQFPRVCTWAFLKEKSTGAKFYFFNVHLDNIGSESRKQGVALILAKVKKTVGDFPVILTGDFNADQLSEPYLALNTSGSFKDAFTLAENPINPKGTTFNNFDPKINSTSRIDHIFLSSHFKVTKYEVLVDSYNGKYPSDHFPVRIAISNN